MFSKEESRLLRQEFWTSFGKSFPRKWLLYNTKIKGLAFKFHFDTKTALIALDLEDNLENRINCWEKLSALKNILQNDYLPDAIYEEEYYLDNGKEISRIYLTLEQKVSIHNKNTWQEVMVFFNAHMILFEAFFEEYRDLIKSQILQNCGNIFSGYTTYLLENGDGLRHIQELLVDAKPETATMIYTHMVKKDLFDIKSPLDDAISKYKKIDKCE